MAKSKYDKLVKQHNQCSMHTRWMIRRDIPEVLDIENSSFPFPWDEDEFFHELSTRSTIGCVAEHQERVIGYMVYRIGHGHLTVLNLAVHPDYRSQNVGRRFMHKLKTKCSLKSTITQIKLDVCENNLSAHLFFKSLGFQCVGVTPDAYEDGQAAYHFSWLLPLDRSIKFQGKNRIGHLL